MLSAVVEASSYGSVTDTEAREKWNLRRVLFRGVEWNPVANKPCFLGNLFAPVCTELHNLGTDYVPRGYKPTALQYRREKKS